MLFVSWLSMLLSLLLYRMVASGFPVNAHVGVVLVVVVGEGVDSVLMTLNVVLFFGTCATSFFSLGVGGGRKT